MGPEGRNVNIHDDISKEPRFPPLQTKFTVPQGAFLAPIVQSSEGGRTYISKSGFERLATSSYFIEELRKDADLLFNTFVQRWKEAKKESLWINASGKRKAGELDEDALDTSLSPFRVFKKIFTGQGWHQAQLFWSENDATRLAMYDSTIRVLSEPLKELSSAFIVNDDDEIQENNNVQLEEDILLRSCASLFALYSMRSTSIIASKHRHTPGYCVFLPLEAELVYILNSLPKLFKDYLQQPQSENGLRPIDDVIFILQELQKAAEFGQRETLKDSAIDVLLPSHFQARPALISSNLSNKLEFDRLDGRYGKIIDLNSNIEYPLNRTEMASTLIREAIDMPILLPTSTDQNHDKNFIFKDEGSGSSSLRFEPATSRQTHWRSADHIGVPITTQQQKLVQMQHDTSEAREDYQRQILDAFGKEGITGSIFTHQPTTSLMQPANVQVDEQNRSKDGIQAILNQARMQTRKQLTKRMRDARQRRIGKERSNANDFQIPK